MTARKAAHSLQRAKGALASGFATVDLHHAGGHDPQHNRAVSGGPIDDNEFGILRPLPHSCRPSIGASLASFLEWPEFSRSYVSSLNVE